MLALLLPESPPLARRSLGLLDEQQPAVTAASKPKQRTLDELFTVTDIIRE